MKQFLIMIALYGCGMMAGYGLNDCKAQTYVITNPQGYQTGSIQVQGNQVQVVNNAGYVTQSYTAYPNQLTTQYGAAIGSTGYTVPPVPPSPPSPRVLQ